MNPIFAAAIEALQQADAELRRLGSAVEQSTTAAAGAEQRLAQLRKNENDLNQALAQSAQQVAQARETINKAPAVIEEARKEGQARAAEVINQATARANAILQDAEHRAAEKIAEAEQHIADMDRKRATAEAQLNDVQGRLKDAHNGFSALKQKAAEFAGR
jgi:chromosome segregation ATPase